MLRLFGGLVVLATLVGAVLALDFNSARKDALALEQQVPDFPTYLSGLGPRLSGLLTPKPSAVTEPAPTADLSKMLPQAPTGWTVRTAEEDDLTPLLPKGKGKLAAAEGAVIQAISRSKAPKGWSAVAMTYEKDDQIVMIKALRSPDSVFVDPAAYAALQAEQSPFFQRSFLRVRGLDVLESNLPDGMRARLFTADVGGQIRLWVLVPKRMKDADLLPFFETLDVRAMNASVVDREDGLGDVPVMFLVEDLDEAGLAAYEAEVAALTAEREERRDALGAALAESAAPATAEQPKSIEETTSCTKGAGGIKRCKVDG